MSTTFKATIEHVNHTTSRATVRTHTFLVDRGVPKGGFDRGPAGGEYMLVSHTLWQHQAAGSTLGAIFVVIGNAVSCAQRGVEI